MMMVDNENLLSTEMIREQVNDVSINEIKKLFNKLLNLYNDLGHVGYKFFKNRDVKVLLERIDGIASKRFGFTCKHTYGKGIGYAVFTAPPKQYNVLNRNLASNYKDIKAYLKIFGKSDENTKQTKDIDDLNTDEVDLLKRWMKSIDSLDKQYRKDGILIDLQKATIKNLPSDYSVFFGVDFDMLIRDAGMTGDELTAVFMHEVGHAFTHLEYSYRTVNNTAVLVDSIQSVIEGNTSFKKALKLSYTKFDGKIEDIDNKNIMTVTLMTIDKYIKSSLDMSNNNTHSVTDSEQLADQFSGKFGLGGDLSNALVKIHKIGISIGGAEGLQNMLILYIQSAVFALLVTGSIMGALLLPVLVVLTMFVSMYVIQSLADVYTGGGISQGRTYDYDARRHKRIKNELVRQLRSTRLPKDVIKNHLENIEMLDNNISKSETEDEALSIFSKIGRVMFTSHRESVNSKKLEEVIEDLMENDLIIASNKLKNI